MDGKTYIYVLECGEQGGYYYVGKTNDILRRVQEHLDGKASTWTAKHRFKFKSIETFEVEDSPDGFSFDENIYTIKYMARYGIDNVRGGSFCQVDLDDCRKVIQDIINCASDKCYSCGETGHVSSQCAQSRNTSPRKHQPTPQSPMSPPLREGTEKYNKIKQKLMTSALCVGEFSSSSSSSSSTSRK
jgi:hypothetical protein